MKTAINTRTQEEYDALMRYYDEKGFIWSNGKKATKNKMWSDERESTCILLDENDGEGITYCALELALDCGFRVIPYTEFAKTIEPDYKAMYLEGRGLLSDCLSINTVYEKDTYLLEEIKAFLTKHNTPNN